jgi:primary-amine oxidase
MRHPLDPLTPEEISRASKIVRPHFGRHQPDFRVVTLQEPRKSSMISFLDKENRKQVTGPAPARCARVEVVLEGRHANDLFELVVDLDRNEVVAKQHQPGKHSYIDSAYMQKVEKAARANDEIQKQIRTLDLPAGSTVVIEPWAYATDGENDMSQRVTMVRSSLHKWHAKLCASSSFANHAFSAGSTFVCLSTQTQTTTPTLSICVRRCRRSLRLRKYTGCPPKSMNTYTPSSARSTPAECTPPL